MSLTNPLSGTTSHHHVVMSELSPEVFDFFFAKAKPSVFSGSRGSRQALIATFFVKLHAECLARGIVPKWLPEQEDVIQEILDNMNFKKKKTKTK